MACKVKDQGIFLLVLCIAFGIFLGVAVWNIAWGHVGFFGALIYTFCHANLKEGK